MKMDLLDKKYISREINQGSLQIDYPTLKSIFHEHNESKMKEEYTKRFNSLASFNTNINIIPMENGKKLMIWNILYSLW